MTDYTYHARGWPTSVTVRGATAEDRVTQISYWPTGRVQQITEPDGRRFYVYDAALRLTDIEDNVGNTIHYTLDNAGNRLKEDTLDTGGTLRRTLARTFNTLGQLTALKDASNHATGFAYDANGNPQTITDALQRVTSQQYDPLNRLAQTLQDVGGVAAEIRSQYNALDQVTGHRPEGPAHHVRLQRVRRSDRPGQPGQRRQQLHRGRRRQPQDGYRCTASPPPITTMRSTA